MTDRGHAASGLPRRVVLAANTDWYLYNFRRHLAETLQRHGVEVVLTSPAGQWAPRLVEAGFRWLPLRLESGSLNPLTEVRTVRQMRALYRELQPDLVHHFTIKCVLYGTVAARLSGRPAVINAITGRGHVFTDGGLKAAVLRRVVRSLYRRCLSGSRTQVIFQNESDRRECIEERLVSPKRAHLIRGSGVDVDRFTASRPPTGPAPVRVLFASRLLREKGILELVEAIGLLDRAGASVQLLCAGELYQDNPSSLTRGDVEALAREAPVTFLGHVEDMVDLINQSDIVALPSYREGTPRILLEAAAMERPIVATDIAGCRGVVDDGVNGYLVAPRDSAALVRAIGTLVADPDLRSRMGKAGRELVVERGFDQGTVVSKTLELYRTLISPATSPEATGDGTVPGSAAARG